MTEDVQAREAMDASLPILSDVPVSHPWHPRDRHRGPTDLQDGATQG